MCAYQTIVGKFAVVKSDMDDRIAVGEINDTSQLEKETLIKMNAIIIGSPYWMVNESDHSRVHRFDSSLMVMRENVTRIIESKEFLDEFFDIMI